MNDDAPAVCERCLGDDPYIEMTRQRNGAQCKICTRPFTVFRWTPRKGGQFNKTVICLTCARARNCCQSCMLDLALGIDLRTRDQLMKLAGMEGQGEKAVVHGAKNEISKIYNANQLEKKFKEKPAEDASEQARELLEKVGQLKQKKATRPPKSKAESSVKLSKADLVRLCQKLPFNGSLSEVPRNGSVKSLFVFGISPDTPNYELKRAFEEVAGTEDAVEAVVASSRGRFGFVQFQTRAQAEAVAKEILSRQNGNEGAPLTKAALLVVDRQPVRVCWAGKSVVSGSDYTREELDKIAKVVRMQLVKLAAEKKKRKAEPPEDNEEEPKKAKKKDHHHHHHHHHHHK